MNLNKIKALLDNKQGLLSCLNFEMAVSEIDLFALENAEELATNYGISAWGEPALSINGDTATIKVRGLLVPSSYGADLTSYGMTGYDVIEHYLAYANNDRNVNTIVLDIDSGGGYVKGVHQCCKAISDSSKPVHTFVSGDMYSGAYWLGVSAESITASGTSGIGSIGVYVEHYDQSEALSNQGVVATLFKTGMWKGAFSSNRKLSDKEKARMQSDIDESGKVFFNHVADNRESITAEAVEALEGDTFNATQAQELGLIDGISEGEKVTSNSNNQANESNNNEELPVDIKAQLAQAKAEGKAEAMTEAKAEVTKQVERQTSIQALDATDEVKAVISSDAYASVPVAELQKLASAMPVSFAKAMDEEGGAGVSPDPKSFDKQTDADAVAERKAEAETKLANREVKEMI